MPSQSTPADDGDELRARLWEIDGRGYKAWNRIRGAWTLAGTRVEVARVQADPFAPPSRLDVHCPADLLGLPRELHDDATRRRAVADRLLRVLAEVLPRPFAVDVGGQQVLERTAARVHPDGALDLRLAIELPDRRRRVRAAPIVSALLDQLPAALAELTWERLDRDAVHRFVQTVEDATAVRAQLADHGLVAFVADGSILARHSGVDDSPAGASTALPFSAPERLRVQLSVPHRGTVSGMGVGAGVTLVVGGGFHGKSTLLEALRAGVYDHVPDDGRELVITRDDAVTIRAEDGRRVEHVDISPFIAAVPDPVGLVRRSRGEVEATTWSDTTSFRSDDASGSTSQAAAVVEAIEAGAGLLLIDEDTAATNLMARDRRMESLVTAAEPTADDDAGYATEPITPYVDLVRSLAASRGVSTVLVAGATGDYLEVADRVVRMDAFRAFDVTEQAHRLATALPGRAVVPTPFPAPPSRVVDPESVDARRRGRVRTRVLATDRLVFGEQQLELSGLDQLVDRSQTAGVAAALVRLTEQGHLDGETTLHEAIDTLFAEIDERGLEALRGDWPQDLARPRPAEVAGALNRLRSLRVLRDRRPGRAEA